MAIIMIDAINICGSIVLSIIWFLMFVNSDACGKRFSLLAVTKLQHPLPLANFFAAKKADCLLFLRFCV